MGIIKWVKSVYFIHYYILFSEENTLSIITTVTMPIVYIKISFQSKDVPMIILEIQGIERFWNIAMSQQNKKIVIHRAPPSKSINWQKTLKNNKWISPQVNLLYKDGWSYHGQIWLSIFRL